MKNLSDETLFSKAKEGNKAAFEEFYQRCKTQVFNYIYRLTGNRDTAEELTQDTFIKAYINLDSYSAKGKPLAWVYTIASNLAKNALKRRKMRSEVSLDAPLENSDGQLNLLDVLENLREKPDTAIRGKELAIKLQEIIDTLPFTQKQILLLCDVQGQSYQDVAQIIGCKPSTVGSRLFRAREKVAKKLSRIYREKSKKFSKLKDASFLQKDYPAAQ